MKILGLVLVLALSVSCSRETIEPGHVGVKIYLYGGDKGVDHEVVGVGRYWLGMNEEIKIFPTFTQTYSWTKDSKEGSEADESISFQSKEGMTINADFGISYAIDPVKVSVVFQKYRKGVEEITDQILRNYVRDALNEFSSKLSVEECYGMRKSELIAEAQRKVIEQVSSIGINVEKLFLIGSMRIPDSVRGALNSKIEAEQLAQKAENEVRKAKAEADAAIEVARGESESNRMKQQSLTESLIKYEFIQKWDGKLPVVTGGGNILDISSLMDRK